MLTIRLQRGGRTHMPIYTIVAADSRNARDGKFSEKLGQYNPQLKENNLIDIKAERISELIGKGATISDTVRTLLKKNKVTLN
ncbi:30S ribosomal protein S16 [Halobacteriovorax sp. GFR7]|uniref:30S ribosomal protein S16 n=1 Tax=unclassified Halobacteriovorax TaxID=2639665 RepID=UPI000CD02E83|nr:30S ribosomal protein S16 [Halobacteriovorax sp. DA5]POB14241.1 30S ribosomal protein S16 [Halobacteriovorax sp. DA5]